MIYIFKYSVFFIFLIFLIYEIVNIYKIFFLKNNEGALLKGNVISISKHTGYVKAELSLTVFLKEENKKIKIQGDFRNTLRWWLQKVPKINDDVYFYTKNRSLDLNENLVYGISINKPCTKNKKTYDLLYQYVFGKSLFIFFIVLFLSLFAVSLKIPTTSFNINYYPLVYLFLRFVIGGVIL